MNLDTINFSFETVPHIVVEAGATTQPSPWQACAQDRHVFLVTDAGLIKAGLVQPVADQLKRSGAKSITVYDQVMADPPEHQVVHAIDAARQAQAQIIIGLGGGSSLDTAKLVALMTSSLQSLLDVVGVNLATEPRLPLVLIPTTAGTGSEVTPVAIITTNADEKKGIVSPLLYPDVAVLDANLTLGLPPAITAMTGIDAMVHAIEAVTSKIKKNPISTALAKEALVLLYHNLPKVLNNGQDTHARGNMLLGSLLAGMAFANAPVGAVHALAYPIGGLFHVPHGLSNALVLAPVLQFNLEYAQDEYAMLGKLLHPNADFESTGQAARWFVDEMTQLVKNMPFAQRLSDVGITKSDLSKMSADAIKIERLLVNNPREAKLEDIYQIYDSVL